MKDILNQTYITASDLQKIMPIGKKKALAYINEARAEMKSKNYFIPESKQKVALTKIIRKKFGI